MIGRRLFLKAAGVLLGTAALPRPGASAATATPSIPATLPGGTLRFLDASGSCVVAVPLTLERLPGALGFTGKGHATGGVIASCTWTLPDGEETDATVGLGPPADVKLGTLDFSPGSTLIMGGQITFDESSEGGRFYYWSATDARLRRAVS